MLCDSDIMEQLNYAYVHAVSSGAGFCCERTGIDRDSIDCKIRAIDRIADDSTQLYPEIGLQLKATVMEKPEGETFPFSLSIKNYNDLRYDRAYPTLLVVYAMPSDKADWLRHTQEGLTSKRCAYWCNLSGLPSTDNTTSRVVYVPSANHFSLESLRQIMYRVSKREAIGNGF